MVPLCNNLCLDGLNESLLAGKLSGGLRRQRRFCGVEGQGVSSILRPAVTPQAKTSTNGLENMCLNREIECFVGADVGRRRGELGRRGSATSPGVRAARRSTRAAATSAATTATAC
jgi:hypothetical protein